MAHNHSHNHLHGHSHGGDQSSKNIALAFFMNLGFAVFEFLGGIYTNSLAITSDALHDLGDSISLGVSWYFEKIAKRPPSLKYSYGLRRFSLIGAIINALVLLTGSVVIILETVPRLINPVQSDAKGMFIFAVVGILVNGYAMVRMRSGKTLNERVVTLHMLEDVMGWVAVLVGSVVMYFFDLPIIDPLLSLGISVFILFNVFKNLRSVVRVILQGVPEGVDTQKIEQRLVEEPGIQSVHDTHIWTMDDSYHVLSAHVVVCPDQDIMAVKRMVKGILRDEFAVGHATIETEDCDEECIVEH